MQWELNSHCMSERSCDTPFILARSRRTIWSVTIIILKLKFTNRVSILNPNLNSTPPLWDLSRESWDARSVVRYLISLLRKLI